MMAFPNLRNRLFFADFFRFTASSACFLFLLNFPLSAQIGPGDLAVVGVVADNTACSGNGTEDLISFICFQDITFGTVLDLTDNGWERANPNLFGDTEGTLRMVYSGATIPKGEVITLSAINTPETYDCISHSGWSFTNINIPSGFAMNLNSGGDQIFFMSGGEWDQGDPAPGSHDASYSGNILFGFNTAAIWMANGMSTGSNLHPDLIPCYHMEPATGQTDFLKYTGPMSPATQLTWIQRLENSANWQAFPSCAAYGSVPSEFEILPSGMSIECTGNCNGCAPVNATLTLNLPTSGGPFNVTYTDGSQDFTVNNAVNGQTINVSVNATTTFSLVSVTSSTGCPVYSSFEGEATVTADAMPDLSSVTNNSPLCEGEILQLDAPFFSNAIYDWSGPLGFNSALEDPQIANVIPGMSGSYTLSVSVNGCNSATVSTNVSILAAPNANSTSLQECSTNGAAVFNLLSVNNIVTGGQPGVTVAWYTDPAGNFPISNPGSFTTSSTTVYAIVSGGDCDSEPAAVSLEVTDPATPQLGTATVCQNSGFFDLNDLVDPNLSAGDWSGFGVNGTNFNPTGLSGNITLTFTPSLPCTMPGTTTITVNVPTAPSLGTATLCQTSPAYSLNNLLDPAFPTGTWAGQGVSGNFFNPAGLSGNVSLTFTPSTSCSLPASTTVTVNVPAAPVLGTATICQSASLLNLATLQDPGFPTGTWSGQGVNGTAFNPAGLSGNVTLTFSPSTGCSSPGTTTVTVNVPPTPQLGTASICQSAGIFDLAALLDPNFPGGTWSGAGVTGSNFDPAGLSGNINLTFTPSASCVNGATTSVAVNVPPTPQLSTTTLCQTSGIFNLSSLADPNFPAGSWSGGGVSGNNFNPAGLSGSILLLYTPSTTCVNQATTFITVNAPATPQLGTVDLCQNATPLDLSSLADPAFPGGTWSGQGVSGGNFNPAGLSGNVALTFTPSATCTQATTTQAVVNTPPTFSNLSENCDAATQTYTVSFTLSGGDPASYSVDGTALGGSTFTSAPIASGGSYTFNIDDANGCGPLAVSGSENCLCATDAGTMNFAGMPLQVCNGSSFTVDHNLDEFLDVDDVLQFVLHDEAGAQLGNVLATSNSATFSFPAGVVLGQTYFVSAVAGTNDGAGNFSPGDNCLSVSQGIPVIFYEPAVQLSLIPAICEGECFPYTAQFSGVAPFDLVFGVSVNGSTLPFSISASDNSQSGTICPASFGFTSGSLQVFPVSLTDGNCTVNFPNPFVTDLTVHPAVTANLSSTLCPGENLVVNGTIYDAANPTGSETFIGGSYHGCDSTVNVSLSFFAPAEFNLTQTLCTGSSLVVNGTTYDEANPTGTEILTNAAASGCDSTIYVNLSFNSVAIENISESLCPGEFLTVNGTVYDENNPSGTETFPGGSYLGCDSMVNVSLSFFAPAEFNLTQTLCPGGSLVVNGTTYNDANPTGTETLPGASANGCDSTIYINLIFNNVVVENLNQALCPGEFLIINGTVYNEGHPSGSEVFPGGSYLGCDSVVNVSLTFFPPAEYNLSQTFCTGGSVTVNGTVYDVTNPTGTEILPGAAASGCDSTVYINLDFSNVSIFNLSPTLCPGEFMFVNGTLYSVSNPSGTEIFPGGSYLGCDSVVNVSLSFYPEAEYHLDMQLCENGSLTVFGQIFNESNPSGVAVLQGASANGCDSIVYVNLTFGDEVIVNLHPILCPGESIFINGTLYFLGNPAGTETFPGGSYLGCDSIVHVNLTFYPEALGSLEQTLPTGSVVVVNGTIYSQTNPSGIEIIEGGSATGCDSVVFVNLTFVASIEAAVKTTSPVCLGDVNGSIEITEIMGGQPPYVVALDGSNSTQVTTLPLIFNDLDAGIHQITFQDAVGTLSVQEVLVPAPPVLLLDLGDDQTIQLGESMSLSAQASFPVFTWQWSPADFLDCADCASPTAQKPTGDVTYLLTATDANGCTVEDEVKIFVQKIREVFVPNAFSPNGDGFNDVLTVFAGQQVANLKIFKVFNRWGAVMFELENFSPNQVSLGWDGTFKGKKMDVGVYVWFVEVEFLDGEAEVFEGGVTLVR